jgi:hypothetical protein
MNVSSISPLQKQQFVDNIQKWVVLEKQLKLLHEKTKEIRESKNALTQDICEYIKTRNLSTIEISDGELKVFEKREYSPLTFKYIEECLGKIVSDADQVEYIMNYLKKNREIKTSADLKRTYQK